MLASGHNIQPRLNASCGADNALIANVSGKHTFDVASNHSNTHLHRSFNDGDGAENALNATAPNTRAPPVPNTYQQTNTMRLCMQCNCDANDSDGAENTLNATVNCKQQSARVTLVPNHSIYTATNSSKADTAPEAIVSRYLP